MSDNMYDEKGILKSEYAWTESQKNINHYTKNIEAVKQANKVYWDNVMIDTSRKDYARYVDLEKAYFDFITPKFNINDKDMALELIKIRQEKVVNYIMERYGTYLEKLLEQYGYGQQDKIINKKR